MCRERRAWNFHSSERKLCSTETEFSQFGVRFGMQPALFSSKKERSFAVFNPVTGGLRELGLAPDE